MFHCVINLNLKCDPWFQTVGQIDNFHLYLFQCLGISSIALAVVSYRQCHANSKDSQVAGGWLLSRAMVSGKKQLFNYFLLFIVQWFSHSLYSSQSPPHSNSPQSPRYSNSPQSPPHSNPSQSPVQTWLFKSSSFH